jgi:hypothetical protein
MSHPRWFQFEVTDVLRRMVAICSRDAFVAGAAFFIRSWTP